MITQKQLDNLKLGRRKGWHHKEETKKKLREKRKEYWKKFFAEGRKVKARNDGWFCKGSIPWNKGKKLGPNPAQSARMKGNIPANKGKCQPIYHHRDYIYIYKPEHPFAIWNGYVAEHRLVIEKSLGRYLRKDELIHHINRIKNDNRLKNLRILTTKTHFGKIKCPKCNYKFFIK